MFFNFVDLQRQDASIESSRCFSCSSGSCSSFIWAVVCQHPIARNKTAPKRSSLPPPQISWVLPQPGISISSCILSLLLPIFPDLVAYQIPEDLSEIGSLHLTPLRKRDPSTPLRIGRNERIAEEYLTFGKLDRNLPTGKVEKQTQITWYWDRKDSKLNY